MLIFRSVYFTDVVSFKTIPVPLNFVFTWVFAIYGLGTIKGEKENCRELFQIYLKIDHECDRRFQSFKTIRTAQKMKFSIKDFFRKYDQIRTILGKPSFFVQCYLCDGAGFNHLFEITWWKHNLMVLKVEMTFISWLMENKAYFNFLTSLDFFLPFKNHLLLNMLFFDCTNFGFSDSVDLFTYYACIVFSNKEF